MNKSDVLIKFEAMPEMADIYGVMTPWGGSVMSKHSLVNYVMLRLAGQMSKNDHFTKDDYVYEVNVADSQEEDYFWARLGKMEGKYFYHSANGYKLNGLNPDRFLQFLSQDLEYGLRQSVTRAHNGVIQVGGLQM